ncbi:MAG: rhomboid family intramembrane serine protease [Flavobacteriales bacterium]
MRQKESIFKGTGTPFLLVIIIWAVHLLNLRFPDYNFSGFGNYPRAIHGLWGILFSPFIHNTDDFSHIIGNSVPLFVLSWLLILNYKKLFTPVIIFIWIFSGICLWLGGRESYHIGASGVIYGLAYFLFFSGIFSKNKRQISISLIVAFSYGSMMWGIFPGEEGISWEGHLFGAISGILMAIYFRKKYFSPDKYNLKVNPEFEEFVDQYNEVYLQEQAQIEELKKLQNTNTTLNENMKVFFEYIKKKDE